jgi:hypothetical protein
MITIELTEEQVEHLSEGARLHGRCALLTETGDEQKVILVVVNNRRRDRRKPAALRAGAAGEDVK